MKIVKGKVGKENEENEMILLMAERGKVKLKPRFPDVERADGNGIGGAGSIREKHKGLNGLTRDRDDTDDFFAGKKLKYNHDLLITERDKVTEG